MSECGRPGLVGTTRRWLAHLAPMRRRWRAKQVNPFESMTDSMPYEVLHTMLARVVLVF